MGWLSHQWSAIRSGGWPAVRQKARAAVQGLSALTWFAVNAVWAIPAVGVIRMIRPFKLLRFGVLDSSRIGHFTIDACVFLASRALRGPDDRTADLFWFAEPTCNAQWARMVRRQLPVRWWVRYLVFFNGLVPGGAVHRLPMPAAMPRRDQYGLPERSQARFAFTAEEDERARAWLRRRGWRDGEPFVGLLVRDSAYLDAHPLHAGGSRNWQYHNYRDSDIATYVEAIQALIDRGYWVICLGQVAHTPLPLAHPKAIDYRFVDDQDDLLDIWLAFNCRFFISTATGIDIAAAFHGLPVLLVNALPLNRCQTPLRHIWVPKHLRWAGNGRMLTLREHCAHGYGTSAGYSDAGITIENLSPAEIAAAVLECEARAAGTWIATPDDEARQRRFWEVFREWPEFHRYHGAIHPEARVGSAWLRSMGDAFFSR